MKKTLMTSKSKILGVLFFTLFGFTQSCGPSTANVTFILNYNSDVVALLQNGKNTTARIWFTFDGLKPVVSFEPRETTPLTDDNGVALFQTASSVGFSINEGFIKLRNLPLNRTGTEIAIELLQIQDDGQLHVVAATCIPGPTSEGWSLGQLKADATVEQTVVKGRTCGTCSGQAPITNPLDPKETC